MQRIVILGNAGSGKSTLARELGKCFGLPVVHLDKLFWQPGWVEPEAEHFRQRVRESVSGERWVCEGNYARRTFDLRLPRANLVIWLDTPRLTCALRVIRRSAFQRSRPDLAEGCHEKFDRAFLGFLKYVWEFDGDYRQGLEAVRMAVAPEVPVVHLRGAREIRQFIEGLAVVPA